MGAADHAVNLAVFAVGIHGHQPVEAWGEIMPHVVHVHGKFFDIREGGDPVVPFGALFRVLVEHGYTGYVSSEYEGWHWDIESDAFEMVARQQALCRQVLRRLATPEWREDQHEATCDAVHRPVGRPSRRGARRPGLPMTDAAERALLRRCGLSEIATPD